MRVLITTAYWHPHRGGVETVAREHARRLDAAGHQVTVLTSRLRGDARRADEDGIAVHRVAAANPLEPRGIPYPLFAPSLAVEVARQVARHDVVIAHSHTYQPSVCAALACRALGRPLVLLQHNSFVEYAAPWTTVERTADAVLGRLTLGLATRRLAVSEESRRYVASIVPGRDAAVLHNGVDTERFHPAPDADARRAIRRRLGLPEEGFLALTVRRLVAKNGLEDLVTAAARLGGPPGVQVRVVGGGPDRGLLEAQIAREGAHHVGLLGFVPDDLLADHYRAADVFVLPSRSGEGFPMAVLEAFASGVPVIATRAGGQVDVVRDGETGWLVPPSSPDAMAAALDAAAAAPEATARLGRGARAVAETLTWDRQVQRLVTHLEEAIHDLRG